MEISKGNDFRAASIVERIMGILPPPPCVVLDVGCGTGMMSETMTRSGYDVTAMDSSEEIVRCARERGTRSICSRVEDLDSPNTFDCVLALDLLEHVEDDHDALLRMERSLKRDGCLIVTVPAHPSLYGPKDRRIGHYRRYSRERLSEMLGSLSFSSVQITYWNLLGFLPVWLATKRGKQVSEEFRYSGGFKNRILRGWFNHIENRISPPIGLTLIAKAVKR